MSTHGLGIGGQGFSDAGVTVNTVAPGPAANGAWAENDAPNPARRTDALQKINGGTSPHLLK